VGNFRLEFYRDSSGRQPARDWMRSLSEPQRKAVGVALNVKLQRDGIGICDGRGGKQLGGGLFELRVQESAAATLKAAGIEPRAAADPGRIMLRVFCHAHGDRVVLILGGYDKSRAPSPRRQQREIKTARDRLGSFRAAADKHGLQPKGYGL
jgi:hypothetical protein